MLIGHHNERYLGKKWWEVNDQRWNAGFLPTTLREYWCFCSSAWIKVQFWSRLATTVAGVYREAYSWWYTTSIASWSQLSLDCTDFNSTVGAPTWCSIDWTLVLQVQIRACNSSMTSKNFGCSRSVFARPSSNLKIPAAKNGASTEYCSLLLRMTTKSGEKPELTSISPDDWTFDNAHALLPTT